MARRCYLIVNPTSGTFSQVKVDAMMQGLRRRGMVPELLPTGSAADPALFAARLCAEVEDPLIAVAGGDGTVNGVLNGLVPGKATLAVIPLGTANVLARELNIASIEDALDRIARGTTRTVSVGEIDLKGERRRFILMAGAGLDGAVVRGVRLEEKRVLGKGAYLLSALREIASWDRTELTVSAAGRKVACHGVIVCNAAKYGGNFVLAPEADLFAPGFQVLCIKGGRGSYLNLALRLLFGKVASGGNVTLLKAMEVEISGRKAVQLDGDYFCDTPLRLSSLADFVRLIV